MVQDAEVWHMNDAIVAFFLGHGSNNVVSACVNGRVVALVSI